MDAEEIEDVRGLVSDLVPHCSDKEEIEKVHAMLSEPPSHWDKQKISNILSAIDQKDMQFGEEFAIKSLLVIFSSEKVKLPSHKHRLSRLNGKNFRCHACPQHVNEQPRSGRYYLCTLYALGGCIKSYCADCAESLPEINHPCHPKPALKLLMSMPRGATSRNCYLCGEYLSSLVYHCSICKFSIHPFCAKVPVQLTIDPGKSHEHALTILPRCVSIICDACGFAGNGCPYICHHCNFVVHKHCISLPRIIKITRHQHRLSLTYSRPPAIWSCGVCRQKVDWNYGAYSCNKGCTYAVHSKCVMTEKVWDGKDLEGEPEETDNETEDVEPFESIDDKIIRHFSHREHHLRLNEDGGVCGERMFCRACSRRLCSGSFYRCIECDDFILHEICANLPKKKLHALHPHPLTLHTGDLGGFFECSACYRLCYGFKYKCNENCDLNLDVWCASISEQLSHAGHAHPLFLTSSKRFQKCGVCEKESRFVLNCMDCRFALCFKCATLPQTVRYKYDEHPLTLHFGKDTNNPYWCEICEKEMNPNEWFYSCDICGTTAHIECALGSLPYVRPGQSISYDSFKFDTVSNNRPCRPLCHCCHHRCKDTSVLKHNDAYLCSFRCLKRWVYYYA